MTSLDAVNTVLKFTSSTNTTATISLCRKTEEAETNCFDGLDNDCDGLVNSGDLDCDGVLECNMDGICDR